MSSGDQLAALALKPNLGSGLAQFLERPILYELRNGDRTYAVDDESRRYLTIAEGFHDSAVRWVVTHQWRDWREEIPWMTIYFSVGVWMSLALANVRPSRASRPSDKESQARAKA